MARRRGRPQSRLYWVLVGLLAAITIVVALLRAAVSALCPFALPMLIAILAGAIYIWWQYRRRRRFRVRAFSELLALTPARFELAIADLLRDLGYRNVQRIGRSGDLAADISCRDKKGRSIVVQCKRYAPGTRVGSRDMQAFIGMVKIHHEADAGIFATTSEFTAPATDLARQHGIILLDGPELGRLATRGRQGDAASSAQVHEVAGPPIDTAR